MIKGTGHMIVSIANDRSMSIESIRKTIKESVLIAYKKYFGSNENAFVKFDDNTGDFGCLCKKENCRRGERFFT